MNLIVTAALWGGVGLGLAVVFAGVTGRRLFTDPHKAREDRSVLRSPIVGRIVVASLVGVAILGVTGWLAAGVLAGLAVWALPQALGGRAAREAAIARTEAIASWIEMVHGSIVAAAGLEEAIAATGPVAPEPIGQEVRALVRRLDHLPLPDALAAFGQDLHHPSGDLVVASLVLAARMEASDLSSLLARLATATRDDARMRIRVEVSRTRVRTGAKVIVGVAAATIAVLVVTNRAYLGVYDETLGQAVLLVAGGFFAVGGWLLDRLAAIDLPERFNARTAALSEGGASW